MHLDDRHDTHVARSERWAAAALKHRAAEKLALSKGNEARAAIARAAAEKAERYARKNGQKVKRLAPLASRARTVRRLNESAAARRVGEAVALAASTPRPEVLPLKEARRLARDVEKRLRTAGQAEAAENSRRRKAGVYHDPRTAAAQRDITIGSRKDPSGRNAEAVASLSDYAALIARRQDRTISRIRAAERFDLLWHRANAGAFPAPKFERGVDVSRGIPGVADDRASSAQELQRLTAYIGADAAEILKIRICDGLTFTWMSGAGYGDAQLVGKLMLRALDRVAVFYGFTASAADHSQSLGNSHPREEPGPDPS